MHQSALSLELYGRLYQYGRWLGVGHLKSDTIYEFRQKIIERLLRLAETTQLDEDIQMGIPGINQLTEHAVSANYSQKPIEIQGAYDLLEIWKDLRSKLRFAIWLTLLAKAKKRLLNKVTKSR
jgi:hypothetical protein